MDVQRNTTADFGYEEICAALFCEDQASERVTARSRFDRERVHVAQQVDSTNEWAGREAKNGAPDGSVFLADQQTRGRGRRGRVWSSPGGTSVYMSVLLRPDRIPRESLSMLTLVMGLAAAEGIRGCCGIGVGIKWPNDVVWNGKKICGILTELAPDASYVVIGIGMNVNATDFPDELRGTATSMTLACGRQIDRAKVAAEVLRSFAERYQVFQRDGTMQKLKSRYEDLLINRDTSVRVLDPAEPFDGIARGINERGELLVERADGEVVAVYAGEVSVRGQCGYV